MGDCCSKEEDSDFLRTPFDRQIRVTDEESGNKVESVLRQDEKNFEVIRRDLIDSPEVFLLNNLLMTVQFFENYRRDIQKLLQSTSNKVEKELNKALLKNESMECICPDTVFEIVNNNLSYQPVHGAKKNILEPLVPRRLFVVTDAIEVISTMDVPQYTSIDKPAYQTRIEESPRKGFVRLRQVDNSNIQKMFSSMSDEPGPSNASDNGSSIYLYATITDLRTPKPLQTVHAPERRDTLPNTCFTTKKVKKPDHELQDIQDLFGMVNEDDLFNNVTYMDAKGFMNYFKNALFPNSLGRSLGFDQHEIDLAKSIPGIVFCNLTDSEDNPVPCEVIPSVAIEWPNDQTFEFIMREDRPTITANGYRYKWPTGEMIKEMVTFNCVVVPKGYWKKKGTYADATIEWEIAFPKGERYIEARMSHAQMKCFLFLVLIHRHYIEPVTQKNGLLVEHIRTHMYWECEANYIDWPEHRLGSKILEVIANLNQRLSKSELPDFFIKQRNHFRNRPQMYLQYAQKIFHEIIQSPTAYFINALRCLQYTSSRFYKSFDYTDFHRILTQTQGYKLINPNLMDLPNLRKRTYQDPEAQWNHLKELNRRRKFLEKMKPKNNEEDIDNVSINSINLDWVCDKQFEIFKLKAIITKFITSYIAIAKDSFKFDGNERQLLFYLKQASYLTKILECTSSAFIPEAREFQSQIYFAEEVCKKSMVKRISDVPPETPVRNSQQFDFQLAQQLKNNVLNMNKLHNSYNSTGVILGPSTSFKLRSPVARNKTNEKVSAQRKSGTTGLPRKSVYFK